MNKWWIVSLLIAWADLIEGGCNVPSIKRLNFYNSIEILNGSTRTLSCEIHSDTKLHKDLPFSGWKRDYPPHLPIEYSLGNASCSVSPSKICIVSNLTLINVIRGEYDGNYSLTVENDCGAATVYVYVNIMVLPKCLNNYYRPPLLKIPPPPIVQAVQGTSVIIKAIYAGHYDDNLLAFWCVLKRDGDYHCFYPNDNTTVYNVTTNGCLPPNFDCCYFIISIEIQSLTFDLSGAKLTSMAGWNQRDPSYCVGNSTLTVNPYPTLYKTYPNASSHCIEFNEGQSTEFTCIYHASADPNVTITTWKFNEELLEQNNSSHYTVVTKYGIDPLHRNSVLSRLILSNLKPDNAGIYTCQCVYSSNVYVNGKDNIGSEAASFCVKVDPGKTWIIIVSVVGFILFVFILMVCCYCYWRRKRRLKRLKKSELSQLSSEEKPLLSESEPDELWRDASSGKAKNATTITAGNGNGDVTARATGTGKVSAEATGTGNGAVTAVATGTGTVTAIARHLPPIKDEQPKAQSQSETTAYKQSSVKPPTLNRFASHYPIDSEKDGEPSSGDKPTITQFNRYVDEIAPRWYDLGAELLQKCVNFLRIIKANHSHDVRICCQEVFNKWIEEDNEASWDSLIDALIKIELHAVAKRIKKDVTKAYHRPLIPVLSTGIGIESEPERPRRPSTQWSSGYLDSIAPEFVVLVNVNDLLPYLLQHQLLNRNEEEHLGQFIHTSMEKAQMLLAYLKRKGADSLQKFLCCLKLTCEHTGHKEVADKLKQLMEANGIKCTNFCSDNCKEKFAKSTS